MKQNWLGDIEHLERFEPFIDRDSSSQLRDYFRFGGLASFERSPIAGMLATAEMFSSTLSPCIYCGGKRFPDEPSKDQGGTGFIGDTTKWTPQMFKRIFAAMKRMGIEHDELHSGIDCPVCKNNGWVTTGRIKSAGKDITARPTGSSKDRDDGETDVDVKLGTCAFVERILDKADVLFSLTTPVLASCFGPKNYGTIGAWHLTPSGKTLLRRNAKNKEETVFFIELRADADGKNTKGLKGQLDAADAQAKEAIDAAYRAWNAAYFVDRCGA
jgi:hypothetical protein